MNCIQNYGNVNFNPKTRTNNHPSFKKFISTETGKESLKKMADCLSRKTGNLQDMYMKEYAMKFMAQIDRALPLAINSDFFDLVFSHAGIGIKKCFEDLSKTITINNPLDAKANKIFNIKDGRFIGTVENETVAKDLVNRVNSHDNVEALVDLYIALERDCQSRAQKAAAGLEHLISLG